MLLHYHLYMALTYREERRDGYEISLLARNGMRTNAQNSEMNTHNTAIKGMPVTVMGNLVLIFFLFTSAREGPDKKSAECKED